MVGVFGVEAVDGDNSLSEAPVLCFLCRPKGSTRRACASGRRRFVVVHDNPLLSQFWHDGWRASHLSLCDLHQLHAVDCLGRLKTVGEEWIIF
jgi:hypothetical protein